MIGPTEIRGVLKKVRFKGDNGFIIGSLANGTTIKGTLPNHRVGQEYVLEGVWQDHPKYGRQFNFRSCRTDGIIRPEGVKLYLMDRCRWVGPVIADLILAKYGKDDALRVCREEPARVTEDITYITLERALEISETLCRYEDEEAVLVRLREILHGAEIGDARLQAIFTKWGQEAANVIQADPFQLLTIRGINFRKADIVATNCGVDPENPQRVRAGLIYCASAACEEGGHTRLRLRELEQDARWLLRVSREALGEELEVLTTATHEEEYPILVPEASYICPRDLFEAEQAIVRTIDSLLAASPVNEPVPTTLKGLATDQTEALRAVCASRVFVLTGSPGTGKTHLIKQILKAFPKAVLTAPTGKAAKRMEELCQREATTIHRLLEPARVEDHEGALHFTFLRSRFNPLPVGVYIVDEVSMVGARLAAALLDALQPGSRLILVGDEDQLPSVGPGNVLRDIIASGRVPTARLITIKRQNPGLIVTNCHHVKNNKDTEGPVVQDVSGIVKGPDDFFFVHVEDARTAHDIVVALASRRIPREFGLDPLRDVQVLSARREASVLSVADLNTALQGELNGSAPVKGGRHYKEGDKVIQTRNDYDLDVMNGDVGYVRAILEMTKMTEVRMDAPARTVTFPFGQDKHLELAYSCTVHKFQGAEAEAVIIPIHSCYGRRVLERNWLYTAISRARRLCVLVGQPEVLAWTIRRERQALRMTGLREMLEGMEK